MTDNRKDEIGGVPPSVGKKRDEDPNLRDQRRSFLRAIGSAGALIGFGGFILQGVRSLIPNVLYEAPRRFKIGSPDNLAEGMTFLDEKRVYVFREGRAFYAISGACTHLGCTVQYAKLQQPRRAEAHGMTVDIPFEFHCPCHGSKFHGDGTNYAGPAPRPLRWYKLEVSPDDGELVVDMNSEVEHTFRLTV